MKCRDVRMNEIPDWYATCAANQPLALPARLESQELCNLLNM